MNLKIGTKLKCLLLAVCVMVSFGMETYAATFLEYDTEGRTLQINGEDAASTEPFVVFAVMPAGMDPAELESNTEETENVLYRTVSKAADGTYESTIVLPDTFADGQYALRTYSGEESNLNLFGYVSSGISTDKLAGINSAGTSSDMLAALKSLNLAAFTPETLDSYGNAVAAYLLQARPSGGYSTGTLTDTFYEAEALARLDANEITLGEMLAWYSSYGFMEYAEEYQTLSSQIQAELESLMKSSDEILEDFDGAFHDKASTAQMKCAKSFEELQELYLDYARDNGISLSEYQNLSAYAQDQVFMNMAAKIDSVSGMSEINRMFATETADAGKNNSGSQNPGGGGGGGGRGGSSSGGGSGATYLPADSQDSPGQNGEVSGSFSDTAGHWAETYISEMKAQGILQGYTDGSFHPDAAVTRAEFVKMLAGMLNIPDQEGENFFDVTREDWFYGVVYGAYAEGLITGITDDEFSPNAEITREDAALILYRAYGLQDAEGVSFADSGTVSTYAAEAVNAVSAAGILNGYEDGTIRPQNSLTRAETAALLSRAASAAANS